jgi:hypothetical protein
MPTYDYHCAANDRVVSVVHRMAEELRTWGELCARAAIDPGETPADAPVAKRISLSQLAQRGNLGCDAAPPIENAPPMKGPFVNPNGW